ncbi:3-phosphoshikimate 1-carboxyvinyltransferase [Breznakiellaceae bacterium SP9]
MHATIHPHLFSGTVRVPASKSHTIRRLLIAAFAEGVSQIAFPLDSLDARSCLGLCRALGAEIAEERSKSLTAPCPNPVDADGSRLTGWSVKGLGWNSGTAAALPEAVLDVGNSGTTLYLGLSLAALGTVPVTFTGDEQIQKRSAGPLLDALQALGVTVTSRAACAPITVQGPWKGGRVSIECPTSQYLSSLLIAAPLAPTGCVTELTVPVLNEKPYIEMTLSYLTAQHILFEAADDYSWFRIPGGQSYKAVNASVPGDFSSAAFPACAHVVSSVSALNRSVPNPGLVLLGLDPDDPQGDKFFFDMLKVFGVRITWKKQEEWELHISFAAGKLRGGIFDLNAVPDVLPAAAVLASYAEGDTVLFNVAHARIKETDRIKVLFEELGKLGVSCTERADGLFIHGTGGTVAPVNAKTPLELDGHGDHRVVMALAAFALGAGCPVTIAGAQSAAVTYPGFLEHLGAELSA